jgi:mycothione reductase
MENFDVIVVGAGSGLTISSFAAKKGLKTAIVEPGPMGGTCLNRGCIPSKMLIHAADVAEMIDKSSLFGIDSKMTGVRFGELIKRVSRVVDKDARQIEAAIQEDENSTLFKVAGKFVGERTLQVGNKKIKGKKVVIAAGTRPRIPQRIEGIEKVPYITSKEALRLKQLPKSLTIIGGGYIGAELAHFFGSLGSKVTIVQSPSLMVQAEDKEIAEVFTNVFSKKHDVLLSHRAQKVTIDGNKILTTVTSKSDGKSKTIVSDELLLAVGRVPNTDVLDVGAAGVNVNKQGYVETNKFMETSAKNVWALGDIAGKWFFKHSANLEAQHVVYNALLGKKKAVDYTAMPHAVFSSPQIAGVGETRQELDLRGVNYAVGKYKYIDSGMGMALLDKAGFVNVYADKKTRKILGCHILGTDASTLIHEVIVAMKYGLTVDDVVRAVHVHPALSEVVQRAFGRVEW